MICLKSHNKLLIFASTWVKVFFELCPHTLPFVHVLSTIFDAYCHPNDINLICQY